MPQRAMTRSRSPSSAARTIGAIWSGKIPGRSGRFPVRSRLARNQSVRPQSTEAVRKLGEILQTIEQSKIFPAEAAPSGAGVLTGRASSSTRRRPPLGSIFPRRFSTKVVLGYFRLSKARATSWLGLSFFDLASLKG
jgi:hypothetical protein